MAIADDISVAVNGDVRYTGTTANYTVIELHRFLQDLADNASSSGDDLHDITDDTSSDRSTDNIVTVNSPYNIDDALAQHLFDGSITQADGDTIYAGLVVVGAVEAGTNIIIVRDNAVVTDYWSAFPNADAAANILMRTTVKTRENGVDIDGQRIIVEAREFGDGYAEFRVTMALGNNTAALFTGSDLNNQTAQATVNAWAITNTEGYQLLEVSGTAPPEPYYSQWDLGVQGINDLYEFAKDIQRRGTAEALYGMAGALFRGITTEWDFDTEVLTGHSSGDEVSWGLLVTYDNEPSDVFSVGDPILIGATTKGRILAVDYDAIPDSGRLVVSVEVDGSPADNDVLSIIGGAGTADVNGAPVGQATGGGSAIVLADDGTTSWSQLTKGTPPADNAVIYRTADHDISHTVNGTFTTRTISAPFIGVSTGSALIGAFGLGVDPTDLTASDLLTDLDGNAIAPPNNVVFSVNGLIIGEDRVLVGPEALGVLELDQLALNTTLSGAAETAVVMTGAIPTDTPSTGTIRIELDDGTYRRIAYTSYTSATFTIASTDFSVVNATAGNNVFISYIDLLATATSETFTGVYSADRALFIRVRDGGVSPIKTFETTGTLGNAGGSTTAIRTSDA